MINCKIIFKVLGSLVILEALLFLVCFVLGLCYGEREWTDFGVPAMVAAALGGVLLLCGRGAENRMSRRDGFLSVSLSWIMFCVVGTMPFLISGYEPRVAAAFFETMSGFSTTGATVLNNIDQLPHSLLFWRSLTHWFGGMGIVFFTIAILPSMGTGDLKLFSAEASGLKLDKLHPRISTTARWILGVYLVLTLGCALAYHLGGMTPFDAVNHAFSTVATGGFSTHQASMAYFHSPRLELIASVFMILSGVNFSLLYLLIIKRRVKKVLTDGEVRCYLTIVAGGTLIIAAMLIFKSHRGVLDALRESFFYVASFQTTTGLTSNNPEVWPPLAIIVLLIVGVCGACAGSTSGGAKCIRVATAVKIFVNEFRHILHPNAVLPLRLNHTTLSPSVATTVFAFFMAYILLMFIGAFAYLLLGAPLLDAFTISISCVSNVGPAFGSMIGPLDSWAEMPDAGLWLSSFLMLAGRLEIFSILLPFAPAFWHDN